MGTAAALGIVSAICYGSLGQDGDPAAAAAAAAAFYCVTYFEQHSAC